MSVWEISINSYVDEIEKISNENVSWGIYSRQSLNHLWLLNKIYKCKEIEKIVDISE